MFIGTVETLSRNSETNVSEFREKLGSNCKIMYITGYNLKPRNIMLPVSTESMSLSHSLHSKGLVRLSIVHGLLVCMFWDKRDFETLYCYNFLCSLMLSTADITIRL